MGIGDWIREARTSVGLSQGALARALETDKTTVYNWERGEHVPGGAALLRISLITGRSLDELVATLGGTGAFRSSAA